MKTLILNLVLIGCILLYLVFTKPEWQDAIGSAGTQLARPVIIPVVDLINTPSFVYVVSILILLSALAICIAYLGRVVRPRLRQLRALQQDVRQLPSPPPKGRPRERGSETEVMHQLGSALREHRVFLIPWAAFQSQGAVEGGIPSAPFASFVAADPSERDNDRAGFMQSLPGYFTSVGLIFTFLGLVVALYFAARGFRSGNIEEARASILQLLNASSFKFLTSVAALVAALIVSLVQRFSLSFIRHESQWTVELIESYISLWRELQVLPARADPFDGVAERLNALIVGMETLSHGIGRLLEQLETLPPRAPQTHAK